MITFQKKLVALANRHPFSAACGAFGVVALLVGAILLRYQSSLIKLHRTRQVEGEAALVTLISGPQLGQELLLTREALRRIEENLSSQDNLEGSLTYFYKIEENAAAHLEDVNPLTTALSTENFPFKRVPFSLKVSGSYPQVLAFLKGVETGPKPVGISRFSLRRRSAHSHQIVLDINLDFLGKK